MSHSHAQTLTPDQVQLPKEHWMRKLPIISGVIGIGALIATYVMGASDHQQMYFSLLVSAAFFLSLGLGCLFFTIIQFATKAGWSVVVRRFAENIAYTLPIISLITILIVWFGRHELFHWTHVDAVAADKVLKGKSPYLNETFFAIRAALYFVVWTSLAFFFRGNSVAQDQSGDMQITRKLQNRSYPSIALFALTLTFAAFDWLMSLDPHWFSTMFGVYFFAGCAVAAFAVITVAVLLVKGGKFLDSVINQEHFHDLGKLIFAFTVFWAYIAFSQYFLIWYSNMPEETIWYAHRMEHGWNTVSKFLAIGHFVVPFFFMLPRTIKRHKPTLLLGALWVLFMHFVDLYWIVMPVLKTSGFSVNILDLVAFIGVGGVFVALVSRNTASAAVVPYRDPRLPESLNFENI